MVEAVEEDPSISTKNDKSYVETGNAELNNLMNNNMFYEKSLSSGFKAEEFKENLIKNLNNSLAKSNYVGPVEYNNQDVSITGVNDRSVDLQIGNIEAAGKGINMDVYPKAIHEFYNYSTNVIYRMIEVAAGFVFDTYKNFLEVKNNSDSAKWKKFVDNPDNDYLSGFGTDYVLPFNDIKGTFSPSDDASSEEKSYNLPEFYKFLEYIKSANKGMSGFATLNPDEYVNIISILRKELMVWGNGDYGNQPIIKLDIQNNQFDLTMMKNTNKYVSEDISVQIVPYILNIIFDPNDSSKNGVPVVAYNVYISFDSICDSIIGAIKWNKAINEIENRTDFINAVLSADFISKYRFHEKVSNAISLFLFNNVHKVFNNFNKFLGLSEEYYDKVVEKDLYIKNLISKVRYCFSTAADINIDKVLKDAIVSSLKHYGTFVFRPENAIETINAIAINEDNPEQLSQLVGAILNRAFSMLNEDSFSVNPWDDVLSTTEYNKSDYISYINGIDDYFIKDFFSTLYNTVSIRFIEKCHYSYLNSNEKTGLDGEKMISKYNRAIHHFYVVLGVVVNVYGNIMLNLRNISIDNYPDVNIKNIINKLKFMVERDFKTVLQDAITYLTSSYLNPTSIAIKSYWSGFGGELKRDSYLVNYISSMCNMFAKCYTSFVSDKSKSNDSSFRKEISQMYAALNIKLKPTSTWRNDTFVNSYNTPELITNFDNNHEQSEVRIPTMESIKEFNKTIMKNFTKSGLISLENSPEFI